MNDLAAELRYRREQRLVAQEMAMDAKPREGQITKLSDGTKVKVLSVWPNGERCVVMDLDDKGKPTGAAYQVKASEIAMDAQPVASTAASSGTPTWGA